MDEAFEQAAQTKKSRCHLQAVIDTERATIKKLDERLGNGPSPLTHHAISIRTTLPSDDVHIYIQRDQIRAGGDHDNQKTRGRAGRQNKGKQKKRGVFFRDIYYEGSDNYETSLYLIGHLGSWIRARTNS